MRLLLSGGVAFLVALVLTLLLTGCRDLTAPPAFVVEVECGRSHPEDTGEAQLWRLRVCPRAYLAPCFETLDDYGNPVSDTLWVLRADIHEHGLECVCTVPKEYRTP